jgi:Uma2 family endonuclease
VADSGRLPDAGHAYSLPDSGCGPCAVIERQSRIVTVAPLLAVEVWSPEDDRAEYVRRIRDFRRMGVENIWIINPFKTQGIHHPRPQVVWRHG